METLDPILKQLSPENAILVIVSLNHLRLSRLERTVTTHLTGHKTKRFPLIPTLLVLAALAFVFCGCGTTGVGFDLTVTVLPATNSISKPVP